MLRQRNPNSRRRRPGFRVDEDPPTCHLVLADEGLSAGDVRHFRVIAKSAGSESQTGPGDAHRDRLRRTGQSGRGAGNRRR